MSDNEKMAGSSSLHSKEELEEIIQRMIAQKAKDDKRMDMLVKICAEYQKHASLQAKDTVDADGFNLVTKDAKPKKKTMSQQQQQVHTNNVNQALCQVDCLRRGRICSPASPTDE